MCVSKKKRICNGCFKEKIIYSKINNGVCFSCFKLIANPEKTCSLCGKLKFLAISNPPICTNCYDKNNRIKECSLCGRMAVIKKKGLICEHCYERPKKKCDFCGKIKRVAVNNDKIMCITCYDKQPENIAKRFNYRNINPISVKEWIKIMEEFDWKCFYCDEKLNDSNRSIDHIVPISKGGTNEFKNIISCCLNCNRKKCNKDITKWAKDIGLSQDKLNFLLKRSRIMEKCYDDFNALVADIKSYIKSNPNVKIIENDDVLNTSIRYQDVENDVSWKISIKDLDDWTKTPMAAGKDYGSLVHRAFQSQEGKQALLDIILKAR